MPKRICPVCNESCRTIQIFCAHYCVYHLDTVNDDWRWNGNPTPVKCACKKKFDFQGFLKHISSIALDDFDSHFSCPNVLDAISKWN